MKKALFITTSSVAVLMGLSAPAYASNVTKTAYSSSPVYETKANYTPPPTDWHWAGRGQYVDASNNIVVKDYTKYREYKVVVRNLSGKALCSIDSRSIATYGSVRKYCSSLGEDRKYKLSFYSRSQGSTNSWWLEPNDGANPVAFFA